jgi:formylmethanofuran dehydrogenase subunit A
MPSSTVQFKSYRGTLSSWNTLFTQAAEFASTISREKLITISHSADHRDGVVTVWYWE